MFMRMAGSLCLLMAMLGGAHSQEKSTICHFTSGPRSGDVEDWGRLTSAEDIGNPCNDTYGSTGTFISRSAPQAATAVRIEKWTTPVPPQSDAAAWALYTDRYHLIHTVAVKNGEPSTNNGLIYTAYACVTMKLKGMELDASAIADGVARSQVKRGLFGRGPSKLNQQNEHDDYWGLGAMTAICGLRNVAGDILAYGTGSDQSSGLAALQVSPDDFGPLRSAVERCTTLLYNYNNVTPGLFTRDSWIGRFPGLVPHWKIAAGVEPTADEFAVWAGALIHSGRNAPENDSNPWLLSWLQVLTYQMSDFYSEIAETAVAEWWKMLAARFPDGGIRQPMRHHLATEADKHPLGKYVENFQNKRNLKKTRVLSDSEIRHFLGPVGTMLTNECGAGSPMSCINLKDFSPETVLNPFTLAENESQVLLTRVSRELETQQWIMDNQEAAIQEATAFVASARSAVVAVQEQHAKLVTQVAGAIAQKNDMINRGLNLTRPAGICWESLCGWCPRHPVPCALVSNPTFDSLLRSIASLEADVTGAATRLNQANIDLQKAVQDLEYKTSRDALERVRKQRQEDVKRVRFGLEIVVAAHQTVLMVLKNAIPCSSLSPIR